MKLCRVVCLFLALLVVGVLAERSSIAIRGDGAQVVWQDDLGGEVVSLARNGSTIRLDGALYAADLYANNVSMLDAIAEADAIIANLTEEIDALRSAIGDVQQDVSIASSLWDTSDMWVDLALINSDLKGYLGGFAMGDYAYCVPHYTGSYHAKVVRIKISDFSFSGVEWFDLQSINSSLVGFYNGFAGVDFGYYVPFNSNNGYHGTAVRINVSDFSPSGVEWFNLTVLDPGLRGFTGGFSNDGFAYYVPHYNGQYHGRVVRVDTSDFSPSGVQWFDAAATVDSGLVGYQDGFAIGEYAYYTPRTNGKIMRINMSNFSSAGVEWFDLAGDVDPGLYSFYGCGLGNFVYLTPRDHGVTARVNISDFSPTGVEWFDMSTTVYAGLKSYTGAFGVGNFVYYVPYLYSGTRHGNAVRINTNDFGPSELDWIDLTSVGHNELQGFFGGFTDGVFGYYVPYSHTSGFYSSKVARVRLE